MLREGVHNGSQGPLLYTEQALSNYPEAWNLRPVVVYHPEKNGQGVSALSPDIIENRAIGLVMHARYDRGALRAEAWLDKAKTIRVDKRIIDAIESGQKLEISTGLIVDRSDSTGVWNSQEYIGIAENLRPDHLAILPDKIGACSLNDGCGLLVDNAVGFNELREILTDELRKHFGQGVYVLDVFDDFVVFEHMDRLYSTEYSKDDDDGLTLTLSEGPPKMVRRRVEYVTMTDGEKNMSTKTKDAKTELVDSLIANGSWEESDREFLEGLDEDKLKKFSPKSDDKDAMKTVANNAKDKNCSCSGAAQPVTNSKNTATGNDDVDGISVDEYVANAPPAIRDMLQAGLQAHNAEKQRLIATITANKANVFSTDELSNMPMTQLQGLAKLAEVPVTNQQPSQNSGTKPNYAGAVGGAAVNNSELDNEPLIPRTMEWTKK